MIDITAQVHPRAHVEDSWVGPRTRIWQFATVVRGTRLGADCTVGAGAVLSGPIFGDGCKVSSGVIMGPGFLVGDRCFLGPHCVFANDVYPSVDMEGYDERLLRSGTAFSITVGNDVMIGSHVTILPGVRIGDGAVLAAGAVVSRNVQANTVWKRDGTLDRVPSDWKSRRMRFARALALA